MNDKVSDPTKEQVGLIPIPSFEDYYIDLLGNVYSTKPVRNNATSEGTRLLAFQLDKDGYKKVVLYRGGKPYTRRVCRLACEAYNGPAPNDNMVVRHKDGSKDNDIPSNLTWGTPKENSEDSIEHGTWTHGESVNTAKLSDELVREIHRATGRYVDIADQYGVTFGTVGHIKRGHTWKHLNL